MVVRADGFPGLFHLWRSLRRRGAGLRPPGDGMPHQDRTKRQARHSDLTEIYRRDHHSGRPWGPAVLIPVELNPREDRRSGCRYRVSPGWRRVRHLTTIVPMKFCGYSFIIAIAIVAPFPAHAASPKFPVSIKGAAVACSHYPSECTDDSGRLEGTGALNLPLGSLNHADDPKERATSQSSFSTSYGFLEVEGIGTAWSKPRTQLGDD